MEAPNTGYSHLKEKRVACIPAFNAGHSIYQVVTKTKEFVDNVIVVDDGSTDNTSKQATKAGAQVFSHPVNLGYGSAIATCSINYI
jgi:glycosyltransferase involved in cell wall biosynthesis